MTSMQEEFQLQDEEYKIQEDYQIWKKNAPFLYDIIITEEYEWPSLTVQWLPMKDTPQDKDYSIQKLILGTNTYDGAPNYLLISKIRLPQESKSKDTVEGQQNKSDIESYQPEIEVKILHEGEINKARFMPQKSNVIATKTTSGQVHIFDYSQHPTKPSNDQVRPQLRLIGHDKEGYGLSWNSKKEGHIVSAGYDNKICYWDLQKATQLNSELSPLSTIQFHKQNVEDVCWHVFHPELFGSVGDDRQIAIWDCRKDLNLSKPTHLTSGHEDNINSIDFSPFNEYLFLTASDDKTISLFDLRNITKKIYSFESHSEGIINVQWSPFNSGIFASCGNDRRLMIWDLSKFGGKAGESQEGPDELLFVHGGHKSKVNDFSWNQNEQFMLASVDDTNSFQVWKMALKNLYTQDQ